MCCIFFAVNFNLTHEACHVSIVILLVDVKLKNTVDAISTMEFCIGFSSDHYIGVFICLTDAPPSPVARDLPFHALLLPTGHTVSHPTVSPDVPVRLATTRSDVFPSAICTTTEDLTDALDVPLPEPDGARFCARAKRSSPVTYGGDLLAPPAGPCRLGLTFAAPVAYSRAGSPPGTHMPLSCSKKVRRALLWAVCSWTC